VFVAVLPVSILRKPPTKALLHQSYSRWTYRRCTSAKRTLRWTYTCSSANSRVSASSDKCDKDITEYVLGFLDGFAYRWFETLDKGRDDFRWVEFTFSLLQISQSKSATSVIRLY
jgi:hypothetical protein